MNVMGWRYLKAKIGHMVLRFLVAGVAALKIRVMILLSLFLMVRGKEVF
jgi:hypothetical protein